MARTLGGHLTEDPNGRDCCVETHGLGLPVSDAFVGGLEFVLVLRTSVETVIKPQIRHCSLQWLHVAR